MQYAMFFLKLLELWAWIWLLVKTVTPNLLLAAVISAILYVRIPLYR